MLFHPMDILIFIAFGLSLWAQFKVRGNFGEWMQVRASSGMTGAQAARMLLDREGLYHIPVEPVPGELTDHYDPIERVVRLSEPVYYGQSIAALSVACHEVGHAIQHKVHYPMLVLRHRIFPVVNIVSGIAPFLLLVGFLLHALNLIGLGILFFSAAVAFQLITLPVEFNASARAKRLMVAEGMILPDEQDGVQKVLGAAALTYLASALIAVLELIKYILIFVGQSDQDE
jgi:Zn-dependent membrane protease YugP